MQLEVWQPGSDGKYEPKEYADYMVISWDYINPEGKGEYKCRARIAIDERGAFSFTTGELSDFPGGTASLHGADWKIHFRKSTKFLLKANTAI